MSDKPFIQIVERGLDLIDVDRVASGRRSDHRRRHSYPRTGNLERRPHFATCIPAIRKMEDQISDLREAVSQLPESPRVDGTIASCRPVNGHVAGPIHKVARRVKA